MYAGARLEPAMVTGGDRPPRFLFLGGMVGNCVYIDSIGILACGIGEYGSAVCTNRQGNVRIPVGTGDDAVDWS
jgi:hypothetical protein